MTAGMTTQKLEGSRVSLPRAGLGALLAATLLAGGLIGAAVSAGISIATSQPAAISVTVPRESNVVRDQRIHAGRGQLVGDTGTIAIPTTHRPAARDGFDHGVPNGRAGAVSTTNRPQARDGLDHGVPNGRAADSAPRAYPALPHASGTGPLP